MIRFLLSFICVLLPFGIYAQDTISYAMLSPQDCIDRVNCNFYYQNEPFTGISFQEGNYTETLTLTGSRTAGVLAEWVPICPHCPNEFPDIDTLQEVARKAILNDPDYHGGEALKEKSVMTLSYHRFKAGKMDGRCSYYVDSVLTKEAFVQKASLDSISIYHPNGHLKYTGKIRGGFPHGKWKFYYPNGLFQASIIYDLGKKEGKYTSWHVTGHKWEEGRYQKDRKDSIWSLWNETGNWTGDYNFYKGAPYGQYKEFFKDGKLKVMGKTSGKDSLADGIWSWFDHEGNIWLQINFIAGYKEGFYREWFPQNSLKTEGFYKNNRKQGLFREWHKDGQLKEQVLFMDGVEEGAYYSWHKNGIPKIEGFYINGKKEGKFIEWDELGSPIRITWYGDGDRLREEQP